MNGLKTLSDFYRMWELYAWEIGLPQETTVALMNYMMTSLWAKAYAKFDDESDVPKWIEEFFEIKRFNVGLPGDLKKEVE